MNAALRPLPDRICGECTACCVELDIDVPEFRKPDGQACRHRVAGSGCAIYDDRPDVCRHWYCGWRVLTLSDGMRPDRSGVLLSPEMGGQPGYERGGLRVVLLDANRQALGNGELIDLVGRCVLANVPIFLSWGDGPQAKRSLVNETLHPFARAGDRQGFVDGLESILDRLVAAVADEAPVRP